jgi:hypothetical protein
MPPQQAILHDYHGDDMLDVDVDGHREHHIVVVCKLQEHEETKQAAHRFDLLDEEQEVSEAENETNKNKNTNSKKIQDNEEEEEKQEARVGKRSTTVCDIVTIQAPLLMPAPKLVVTEEDDDEECECECECETSNTITTTTPEPEPHFAGLEYENGKQEESNNDMEGYWYCGKGFKKTILEPISERHVTFAGQVIRNRNDGRVLSVLDAIKVTLIPHVSEYTKKQKSSMWYTRKEMMKMKQLSLETARKISKSNHTELYCRFFSRGLERLVDYQINDTGQCTTSNRRYEAVTGVLKEQYNQRVDCLKQYGMMFSGVQNLERLKSVYTKCGNTEQSLIEAQQLAKQDEIHANDCTEEFYQKLNVINNKNDDYHHRYHHNNNKNNNNIVVKIMNFGVNTILKALIAPLPFFEIRQQRDIFLSMGEECF